jgi:hypothetical protein
MTSSARTFSESGVVSALASAAYDRLTQSIIRNRQRLTSGELSGDDSGLRNVWDEICVQIQYDQSVYWDAYDETTRSVVAAHVASLA